MTISDSHTGVGGAGGAGGAGGEHEDDAAGGEGDILVLPDTVVAMLLALNAERPDPSYAAFCKRLTLHSPESALAITLANVLFAIDHGLLPADIRDRLSAEAIRVAMDMQNVVIPDSCNALVEAFPALCKRLLQDADKNGENIGPATRIWRTGRNNVVWGILELKRTLLADW